LCPIHPHLSTFPKSALAKRTATYSRLPESRSQPCLQEPFKLIKRSSSENTSRRVNGTPIRIPLASFPATQFPPRALPRAGPVTSSCSPFSAQTPGIEAHSPVRVHAFDLPSYESACATTKSGLPLEQTDLQYRTTQRINQTELAKAATIPARRFERSFADLKTANLFNALQYYVGKLSICDTHTRSVNCSAHKSTLSGIKATMENFPPP
jgi:hypothetical protein